MNAVAVVYSLPGYPNGLIVTGSNDQVIAIHDIESNSNIAQLKEHDGAGKKEFDPNNINILFYKHKKLHF